MSSHSEVSGKMLNPFLCPESEDDGRSWLSRAILIFTEDKVTPYNGPKFDFMNCLICKSMSSSPVYFCSKGHVFCYSCAADLEFCSHGHHSEKIRQRNILPYDLQFRSNKLVHCIRRHLGCLAHVSPKNYLQHVQFGCSFRASMNCFMNNCKDLGPKIYWGFIDTHLAAFHMSDLKNLSPMCIVGHSNEIIPYDVLEEGNTLNPFVLNIGNVRKFIPAIKKDTGKIYFWVDMIEDGYVHDYQYSQFHATIKVQAEKDSQPIIYKGIVQPVRKLEDNITANHDKGIDIDVVDFEKKCLFDSQDPYFVVQIEIEERKIVVQAKAEEESKGYGDLPPESDIHEDFDAVLKDISYHDIIFPNHLKINYEVPEEVPEDIRSILAKREELEKKRMIAEYLEQQKPDIDFDYYKKVFPDKTPLETEKEKTSIEKYRQSAVESGKLTVTDIARLEKNFSWSAADVEILESFGMTGFSRLPTFQDISRISNGNLFFGSAGENSFQG